MCKVSVIVPAYNSENYIDECITSILSQTLRDIQIICVNDGSSDKTAEILHGYAKTDSRISVIDQANAGYGRAINVGLQAATGEYVGIVEADDYIAPKMYESLWQVANQHKLDFVKSDYEYFSDDGTNREFDRIRICPRLRWYQNKWRPNEMPALLDVDMMNVTGIYKRTFLLERHIALNETPGAAFQDTGLWIQIFTQASSCMFIPKSFYKIRRDNPNSSVMQPEKFDLICNEYDWAIERLTKQQQKQFGAYIFKRRVFAYQFILSRIPNRRRENFISRFSEEVQAAKCAGIYDPQLFTETMNCFLKEVSVWTVGQPIPTHHKSKFFLRRITDCVQEHGVMYLLRRVEIRLNLRKEIF